MRGPKTPTVTISTTMAPPIYNATPSVPPSLRKNPISKPDSAALTRLHEYTKPTARARIRVGYSSDSIVVAGEGDPVVGQCHEHAEDDHERRVLLNGEQQHEYRNERGRRDELPLRSIRSATSMPRSGPSGLASAIMNEYCRLVVM